eukprot:jgi/Chlat1/2997/Chrsp2S08919
MAEVGVLAEQYVKLVLALGKHDESYVDAYYGPKEWAEQPAPPLPAVLAAAQQLLADVAATPSEDADSSYRLKFLLKQLQAMVARARILSGETMSFDEEAREIFDTTVPRFPSSEQEPPELQALDALLPEAPGGSKADESKAEGLVRRWEHFRSQFRVPEDKLDAVFSAALDESRKRSAKHIQLPDHESFTVEYVKNKPWTGYNRYKGNARSVIQLNTDIPITIDRAIDVACHEAYPGHHVFNTLMEEDLFIKAGWVEFTVYPLYSPQSLIAEGTAEFGIEVAFPTDEERLQFEKDVLFPIAGLDASQAKLYFEARSIVEKLHMQEIEVARDYLDKRLSRQGAVEAMRNDSPLLMRIGHTSSTMRGVWNWSGVMLHVAVGPPTDPM